MHFMKCMHFNLPIYWVFIMPGMMF